MDQLKVGELIKQLRKKDNLSQKQFAEKYGVTYQAVSKWETGKNLPDIAILNQMCKDYNLNLDEILNDKQKKKNKKKLIYLVLVILCIMGIFIGYKIFHKDEFEFKTLNASCDYFNLYGSIAYNDDKSSIYISNITYCGEDAKKEFKFLDCTLYEVLGKEMHEIISYEYEKENSISLEKFLSEVTFQIDDYKLTCNIDKENALLLKIVATDLDNKEKTYDIPLVLKENCSE